MPNFKIRRHMCRIEILPGRRSLLNFMRFWISGLHMLDTPVVMIVFRRPEHTERVLLAIRRARPKRLLIIADGPNPNRPGEVEKCAAARAVVDRLVDWDCELLKNYSETNLGVERRFHTGFDWVFEQCESAIILEDDELPDDSFFDFCQNLLKLYRDDERVMAINGTNYQFDQYSTPHSYYFSRYFHCWGFATWRRAWKHYDVKIRRWPELRGTPWLMDICAGNNTEARYHAEVFDRLTRGEIHTWDYQVTFAMWANSGLAITPNVNLVSNIGFGAGALHHTGTDSPFANMATVEMPQPLLHPPSVLRDLTADRLEYERLIEAFILSRRGPLSRRILHQLRRIYSAVPLRMPGHQGTKSAKENAKN